MQSFRTLSRREALVLLGGATITIAGCGGGGSSPSGPSTGGGGSAGDKTGSISGNHGHTAVLTAAQLGAGGALSLNIQGSSPHPHTVALSGAEVTSIAGGSQVSKVSSNDDGHTHTVTFN